MIQLTAENHRLMLSDGNAIPVIGLGTYADPRTTPKGTCAESVKIAIDAGYRHFDGAFVYHNEDEVGQAIREKIAEGKIKREDIFYCGKVPPITKNEKNRRTSSRPSLHCTLPLNCQCVISPVTQSGCHLVETRSPRTPVPMGHKLGFLMFSAPASWAL